MPSRADDLAHLTQGPLAEGVRRRLKTGQRSSRTRLASLISLASVVQRFNNNHKAYAPTPESFEVRP